MGIFYSIIFGYFVFGYTTDPDSCLATDESKKRIEPEKDPGEATDVGEQFMFAWKIQFVFGCVILPIGCVNYINEHMSDETWMMWDTAAKCAGCFCAIAWILALFYRYVHTGMVCSGDFL